ncbi:hypothetical protein MTAT_04870 [Moorella thermoacetica]|uniref:Helix-turn-helix domain protein n=1 Tax=Neomoorella thermoacetica TaxID=1525 RepID=A0AAC9HHC3_NEOTH|nr:Helix-turn-helix domain protein [Moorella thermoacetica]TYL14258.1 hypothetical protein MTAT_04870 [Moorella thermoacetica]
MLRLKQIRLQRGLSLTRLCQLTGIHPSNLSRIEKGLIYPYPGWRKRLTEAIGVPEDILFEVVKDENSGRTA